jgi:hypothetical protein
MMKQRVLLLAGVIPLVLAVGVAIAAASPGTSPPPTGERTHGQSVLEPVFNAENYGEIGYVNTPNGTKHPVPSNPKSWSPIYVVEYPKNSTINTSGSGANGPLNCWHMQGNPLQVNENCPTHGNDIAGAAAAIVPSVYSNGALGHDHVMDFPGGADWNVAWEPILVLFTQAGVQAGVSNTRLLTDTAIDAAVNHKTNGAPDPYAIEIPLPDAAFHCSLVSDSVWALSSPFAG